MFKKILALALVLMMAFSMVACDLSELIPSLKDESESSEPKKPNKGEEEGDGSEIPDAPKDPNRAESEAVKDPNREGNEPTLQNFDGYEFRILTNVWSEDYEVAAPTEMNGQGVNDQIYDRNKKVEYWYNITIVEESRPDAYDSDAMAFLNNMKVSGDYYADLYSFVAAGMIPNMATQGHFVNLYDERVSSQLRLKESWWDQDFLSETTINGHAYCLTGDIQVNDDLATLVLAMNNTLYKQYYADVSIYDTVVTNKAWTFEKFFSLWQNFGQSNGTAETGAIDQRARVGYAYDSQTAMYYMISSGIKTFKMNSDGQPELNVNSEKALGVVDWLKKLVKANPFDATGSSSRVTGPYRYTYDSVRSHFQSGGLLFATTTMFEAIDWYNVMSEEVVYLPFPKFDRQQENYYSPTQWLFEPLAISANVTDLERTALITEALAFYSDKLDKEITDLLLQERLHHDADSRALLEFTLDSKTYDMDYLAGVTGLRDSLSKMIGQSSFDSYASSMKALSSAALKTNGKGLLQRFVKAYTAVN